METITPLIKLMPDSAQSKAEMINSRLEAGLDQFLGIRSQWFGHRKLTLFGGKTLVILPLENVGTRSGFSQVSGSVFVCVTAESQFAVIDDVFSWRRIPALQYHRR
ncbi:hypothetical protein O9929_01755 [Vibrio lentus]|nr:hypothetical protein [Vibrio lentus]